MLVDIDTTPMATIPDVLIPILFYPLEALDVERVDTGLYVAPLNYDILLPFIHGVHDWEAFGVVDDPRQVLERRQSLAEAPEPYVILCSPILKSEQPETGGWRWHKWGDYLGDQTITTEYLYDEPLIEKVYAFRTFSVELTNIIDNRNSERSSDGG